MSGAPPPPPPAPGRAPATEALPWRFGDYEVLELVEQVGGASTYRARQVALQRVVTLTILPPDEARKAAYKTRFERQFAAASRLRHPNVVAALDAGTIDGHRYIAAEFAGGRRLSDALAQGEWFPIRRCLAVAQDMAEALAHLETHGIVHRGVTPSAVVLAESGVAKLRGFSLSKDVQGNPHETWFDLDVEAARYTAPEIVQMQGRIDARADIYSLACVLYHMITGRPPFDGRSASAVLMKHVNEEIADPRALREDLPEVLAALLDRCLRRERNLRPPAARALVVALRHVASDRAAAAATARKGGWLRRFGAPRRPG